MWHQILLAQHYSHSGQCMNLPTRQSEQPCYKSKSSVMCINTGIIGDEPSHSPSQNAIFASKQPPHQSETFERLQCYFFKFIWNRQSRSFGRLQRYIFRTWNVQLWESTWTLQLGQSYTWRLAWIMQANHGNHTSKKKWVNTWQFTGQELTYIWKR